MGLLFNVAFCLCYKQIGFIQNIIEILGKFQNVQNVADLFRVLKKIIKYMFGLINNEKLRQMSLKQNITNKDKI